MTARGERARSLFAYVVAGLGAFLIVAVLVWQTHRLVQPPPLAEDRAAVRRKNLVEVRSADAQALSTAGWVDQARGIVRLPLEEALRLAEREWQDPAQARSNLMARLRKATAPAPKAPEQPSQYE